MNIKFLQKLIIIIIIPSMISFAWGEKGHKVINGKAVDLLPPEMSLFKQWKNYIIDHASDADKRKAYDKTEGPKHFIDLDYYKEFNSGEMIENLDSLIEIYGDSVVTVTGTLPWSTYSAFTNLVASLKDKDRDKSLIYASDLGHYVADGHQPLHVVLNYNGQLTNQKGIHARYEINMVDSHINELDSISGNCNTKYVTDPQKYIFRYIYSSNSFSNIILDADETAQQQTGSTQSEEYYKILWNRTKYMTENEFTSAENAIASLIYTAWIDAGKPKFSQIK